jgi:hypothetical protein
MADKIITDLQLIAAVTDSVSFPVDDGIQSYRATAAQIAAHVLPTGAVTTAKLADGVFSGLTGVSAQLNDYVAIADTSDSNNKKKALVSSIINESITEIDHTDSPYAIVATDRCIVATTSGGHVEVDLPASTGSGRKLIFKRDKSDYLLTLDPDGTDEIDDEANFVSWLPYDVTELVDTSNGWRIINKSGSLPVPVAWVVGSAQTVSTAISGTYSRTGTTVTVTATAHGHKVGHKVRIDATSGTMADGIFRVTSVIDANNFTFEHGTSGATSGNCNLLRLEIYKSKNVHSLIPHANTQSAENYVNLSQDMPDLDYYATGSTRNAGVTGNDNGTTSARFCNEVEVSTERTINSFKTLGSTTSSGSSDHNINMMVFR